MRFSVLVASAACALFLGGRARADAPAPSTVNVAAEAPPVAAAPSPPTPPRPRPGFVPYRPLAVAGAATFGAGYAPALALGVPSTLGLVGRVFWGVFTVGIGPWLTCGPDGSSPDSYLCKGEHGALQLLLPIAGPLLFAENHPHDSIVNPHGRELGSLAKAGLFASGATQAAGVALLVGSVALGESVEASGARHRRRSVAYAGGLLLAASYAAAFAAGAPSTLDWMATDCRRQHPCRHHFGGTSLLVPLAGPLLLAAGSPRDDVLAPSGRLSATARTLLVADGVAQISGAVLLGAGLLVGGSESPVAASPRLRLAPMFGGGAVGLTAIVE